MLRAVRTRYEIVSYQETYFVINSFQELFGNTAPDSPLQLRFKRTRARFFRFAA